MSLYYSTASARGGMTLRGDAATAPLRERPKRSPDNHHSVGAQVILAATSVAQTRPHHLRGVLRHHPLPTTHRPRLAPTRHRTPLGTLQRLRPPLHHSCRSPPLPQHLNSPDPPGPADGRRRAMDRQKELPVYVSLDEAAEIMSLSSCPPGPSDAESATAPSPPTNAAGAPSASASTNSKRHYAASPQPGGDLVKQ